MEGGRTREACVHGGGPRPGSAFLNLRQGAQRRRAIEQEAEDWLRTGWGAAAEPNRGSAAAAGGEQITATVEAQTQADSLALLRDPVQFARQAIATTLGF